MSRNDYGKLLLVVEWGEMEKTVVWDDVFNIILHAHLNGTIFSAVKYVHGYNYLLLHVLRGTKGEHPVMVQ